MSEAIRAAERRSRQARLENQLDELRHFLLEGFATEVSQGLCGCITQKTVINWSGSRLREALPAKACPCALQPIRRCSTFVLH